MFVVFSKFTELAFFRLQSPFKQRANIIALLFYVSYALISRGHVVPARVQRSTSFGEFEFELLDCNLSTFNFVRPGAHLISEFIDGGTRSLTFLRLGGSHD